MNKRLKKHATTLALELYDAIPKLRDIDRKSDRLEDPVYAFNELRLTVFNGSVSRSISWRDNSTEYRLWFEVRGMVHFHAGAHHDDLIYQQVVYDEFPRAEMRDRENTFEGDIQRFIDEGERIKAALPQCSRTSSSDVDDGDELTAIVNIGPEAAEKRRVAITISPGTLTRERYAELAEIAYRDIPDLPEGVGGFVTLVDTNAEIQGYHPRNTDVRDWTEVSFRNAAALNLEVVSEPNSLAVLAQEGKVTIEDVQLG